MLLPDFTDQEIEAVARSLSLECDPERMAVLRYRMTADIRACAGSGKTSLLVAKLALLADHWSQRWAGIAVLSHTNVAQDEIRQRFDAIQRLRLVERYPFFLGTIQSFVNMSLGIPGTVRRFGVRPRIIDNELSGIRAVGAIKSGIYRTASSWLANRPHSDSLVRGLRVELREDGELCVGSASGTLPAPSSDTSKELHRLKKRLMKEGIFRHDDMDAIGLWYAHKYPAVVGAIASRFPVVLIDETQDTNANQGTILDHVFNGRSIVQRFGDDRQAIYSDANESEEGIRFPKPQALSISRSFRCSPSIAKLAENVAINAESLVGNTARPTCRHTVFLFRAESIEKVIPAFARLVAAELGTGRPYSKVMAVGFRRSITGEPKHFPMVIGDYANFDASVGVSSAGKLGHLTDFITLAEISIGRGRRPKEARALLLDASVRILEIQGITDGGRRLTAASMLRQLDEKDTNHPPTLLRLIGRVILGMARGELVEAVEVQMLRALKPIAVGPWNPAVRSFCEPQAGDRPPFVPTPGDGPRANIFSLSLDQGRVDVGIDTIHSVKGLTLDAVLLLTTYFRCHDLKEAVESGLLSGERPKRAKARQALFASNVKRLHVAMTRPTSLLCLAMHEDHLTQTQRTSMEGVGWTFNSV